MANLANLKADFNSGGSHEIYTNGEQAITGEVLNYVLNNIVNTLGDGYRFKGIVTPSSAAITTDNKVFVVASEAGTYTNFGGLTVAEGELAFLYHDTAWHKGAVQVASTIEIVNDLTTGGADKALSAEMGKALNYPLGGGIPITGFSEMGHDSYPSGYSWVLSDGVYTFTKGSTSGAIYSWIGVIPNLESGKSYTVEFDYELQKTPSETVWFMARTAASGTAASCGGGAMNTIGKHHVSFRLNRNDAKYFIFSSINMASNSWLKISNITIYEEGSVRAESLREILTKLTGKVAVVESLEKDVDEIDTVAIKRTNLEGTLSWEQGNSNPSYVTLVRGEDMGLTATINTKGTSRFGFYLGAGYYRISMTIKKNGVNAQSAGAFGYGESLDSDFVSALDINGDVWRVDNGLLSVIINPSTSGYYYLSANSFSAHDILAFSNVSIQEVSPKVSTDIPAGLTIYEYAGKQIKAKSKVAWERYMNLSHQSGLPNAQGSCIYGDYFFQGYTDGGYIAIFDLVNKTRIATMATGLTASGSIHFNTLCFGVERYVETDAFPLLYACSGYVVEGVNSKVYAFRVVENNGSYSLSLVQTLSLPFNGWTEFVIDRDFKYCYVKDASFWYRFNLPLLADGNVSLDEESEYYISKVAYRKNYVASDQGHFFYDGRIYYTSGVPTYIQSRGETGLYLCVFDPLLGRYDTVINLIGLGLYNGTTNNIYEPEGIFEWRGHFYIPYRDFIIKMYF